MTGILMAAQHAYYWAGNVFAFCVVSGGIMWAGTWLTRRSVEDSKPLIITALGLVVLAVLAWIIGFVAWIGITTGFVLGSMSLVGWPWTMFYGGGLILVMAVIWSFISGIPAIKWRYWWINEIGILPGQGLDETMIWFGIIVGAIGWGMITIPF